MHDGLPATLICDSAAAALMGEGYVDAVVVGADRVVANGDTANKIGTYSLGIAAAHHGVPFFVAAPTTTLDATLEDGSQIVIEQRPPEEVRVRAASGAQGVAWDCRGSGGERQAPARPGSQGALLARSPCFALLYLCRPSTGGPPPHCPPPPIPHPPADYALQGPARRGRGHRHLEPLL